MRKIAVVTDSTSNLPPELAREYDIPMIPLKVHWGEDTYLDGVTLMPDTFYRWLGERKDFPTTSQPSAGEFMQFFQEAAERFETDTLVGVFISADMSGTLASAIQAKAELSGLHIELLDSRSVSMGLGFQVLTAARAADAGASLEEIVDRVHQVRARMQLLFTVQTLEFLHRGGRIGGAARLLGTALNLKPLLTVEGGRVEALEKVRSRRKSLQRLMELAETRLAGRRPSEVAVLDVNGGADADWLVAQVAETFNPPRIYRTVITPVVGTHAGPGTVGVVFYAEP